jgi:hypothetical protein
MLRQEERVTEQAIRSRNGQLRGPAVDSGLGIYALSTREADFTFALVVLVLVVVAGGAGLFGFNTQIGL